MCWAAAITSILITSWLSDTHTCLGSPVPWTHLFFCLLLPHLAGAHSPVASEEKVNMKLTLLTFNRKPDAFSSENDFMLASHLIVWPGVEFCIDNRVPSETEKHCFTVFKHAVLLSNPKASGSNPSLSDLHFPLGPERAFQTLHLIPGASALQESVHWFGSFLKDYSEFLQPENQLKYSLAFSFVVSLIITAKSVQPETPISKMSEFLN